MKRLIARDHVGLVLVDTCIDVSGENFLFCFDFPFMIIPGDIHLIEADAQPDVLALNEPRVIDGEVIHG